jgi:two-component system LytT family sensor kinase
LHVSYYKHMMRKTGEWIFRMLTSRLALNIYVWFTLVNSVYNNNIGDRAPLTDSVYIFHVVLMHLIWLLLVYGNTLVLVPRFLLRRKYLIYAATAFTYAILFSLLVGYYSEWLIHKYPGTHKYCYIGISIPYRFSFQTDWRYLAEVFFISVCIPSILFTVASLTHHFFKERRRNELLGKKQTESELLLLKSQINPHFLFNVLNSIYALSLKKSDHTPEIILKLSDILRYMLYESRQDFVPIEKELQMIRDYIAIEQIRLSDKNAINLDISEGPYTCCIAPAILISFVENAIKHGLDSQIANAFVTISITLNEANNELHFYCSNNYLPRNRNMQARRDGGIGLDNVSKRLELLYPGRYQLRIKNEDNRFDVNLSLKLNAL